MLRFLSVFMSSFGSDNLREEIVNGLESAVEDTEFEIMDELKDTKRLRAELDQSDCRVEVDVDIKDEYVSVKHNVHDEGSSMNVKQRFFDNSKDAVEWIEDRVQSISEDPKN